MYVFKKCKKILMHKYPRKYPPEMVIFLLFLIHFLPQRRVLVVN